ncbi:LEAF RUST 10 DISEASE-RESISTANCE LOCUS RECEPTOR-LIKE PROTEIN KINASE-like protein 2.4 [Cinnamomum micranthum f. kanehirae]|uniref:LEAF RUST 10 DISEASE-RESISTANCE LOCUS RECEPTOR-LIKE PROTEIN KINASE-like protein 2.4 n=1 Tax=Cinnamomum micranthum f. kanehirae TaxID=337451 RepID=A0A443ND41_9MAGN|nr:LEAF RUST 10 DISEASE-RESISTANCE LOCUS RECEPTOR-LIKE PROTEIN KINASE-like protein 2.4 [Cinnamomum micranthum f. kanehirae]
MGSSNLSVAMMCVTGLALVHISLAQNSPQDYLNAHNAARNQVGVGPLVWDNTVAAYAQDYAKQRMGDCSLTHSNGPYGENLFWGSGAEFTATQAVNSWVNEKQDYDYNTNTCAAGKQCGHYTQVVWGNSTRLGCARVKCDSGAIFITCNYDPPGNYVGSRFSDVIPPLLSAPAPGINEGLGPKVPRKKAHFPLVIIGVSIPGILIFMAAVVLLFYLYRRKSNNKTTITKDVETFLKNNGSLGPKRYKYSELKKMTNSFRDEVGHGGFGCVFKGRLPDGRLVAVKVLSESKGNGQDFINEVASIGKTYHVNVVSLLGFCFEGSKRALIYEYMPNGSLDRYIYGEKPRNMNPLGWDKLYKIALEIARGLEYLHVRCSMRILHLDIKPHNILLDENFCPKISDFGLAKLCPTKESTISTLTPRGTIGYTAPEVHCRNFGGVSYKSDVYSYGMMVLEMVGGRRNIDAEAQTSQLYFPQWIYKCLNQQGSDIRVEGLAKGAEEEMARKMSLVGLWCIQMSPADRPSMSQVVEMFQGSNEDVPMPPNPFPPPPR